MPFAIIDPFDAPMLHVLEDRLGVVCFCSERPWQAPYCPVHNPRELVDRIDAEAENAVEEAVADATEKAEKSAEEDAEEKAGEHQAEVRVLKDELATAEETRKELQADLDKALEDLDATRDELRKLKQMALVKS